MATVTSIHATDIRSAIRAAEAKYDEAQAAVAQLKIEMLKARAHPDIQPGEAQELFLRLANIEKHTLSSSGELLRVHRGLDALFRVHAGPTEPGQDTWPIGRIANADAPAAATEAAVPALVD